MRRHDARALSPAARGGFGGRSGPRGGADREATLSKGPEPAMTPERVGMDPVLLHGSVVALVPAWSEQVAPPDQGAAAGFDPGAGADLGAAPAGAGAAGVALPRGVLITGASGSGKSALALALMALGARLVADDRVVLHARNGALIATCPAPLAGLIEARGVGLLRAEALPEARIALVVDLDRHETDRLPHPRQEAVAGVSLPCLHKVDGPYFPAAILQYLKAGRVETA